MITIFGAEVSVGFPEQAMRFRTAFVIVPAIAAAAAILSSTTSCIAWRLRSRVRQTSSPSLRTILV
jgi:hypothetical protein